jgi:AcrR family transcriptional regulator
VSNADETRARILETAWRMARERGLGAVTIAEIAAAAGVSRQLVYVHFSNRAGLLVAMTRHQDARSGFRARAFATRELEPVAALEELMRAWQAYVPEILVVAGELEAALLTGGEAAGAWRDRMGELREAFRLAIDRIAAAGALAEGWTVDAAADWVWARCQPTNRIHLVAERGWDAREYDDRTTASILREVVTSAQPNV